METEIYLIRHGETTWNFEKKIQGQLDSPLTDIGIQQGHLLGERMIKINPDVIYTSNLKRAIDTANLLNENIKKEIVVLPSLKERNWGIFQGATWERIKNFYPKQYKFYKNDSKNYVVPNGESYAQVLKRITDTLDFLVSKKKYRKIVIVTHGGIISPLIREILSLPYESYRRLRISNSSITKLVYNELGTSIITIGDISHLEGNELS